MKEKQFYLFVIVFILGTLLLYSCGIETEEIVTGPPFISKEKPEGEGDQLWDSSSVESDAKVQVIMPWQGVETVVKTIPIPKEALGPDTLYSTQKESFTLVANFKIYQVIQDSEELLTRFNPPFELRVEYTAEQFERSQENGYRQPRLIYWNQEDQKWLVFDGVEIDPVDGNIENGGFLFMEIIEWVDPPIGIVT